MKQLKFTILLSLLIIFPTKINLANQEITEDSNSLEGIEQRNLSNLNNLTEEGYSENPLLEDLLPTNRINLEIKKDSNNFFNSTPSDDKSEKLNSNYGDEKPSGGSIPFLNF